MCRQRTSNDIAPIYKLKSMVHRSIERSRNLSRLLNFPPYTHDLLNPKNATPAFGKIGFARLEQ